ncbi:unnamed protein product, partial [Ectocarpus sp. 12 AP-2014]
VNKPYPNHESCTWASTNDRAAPLLYPHGGIYLTKILHNAHQVHSPGVVHQQQSKGARTFCREMAPRLIPPLLLFTLLGRRDNVRASTTLFTRATRQPTATFSELAFAVPPPAAARPPARSPAGGAWTSRSSNRAVSTTTTRGDSERSGVCPLALTRRGRADTTATAPPPSSSLSRRRKSATVS